jgi:hypothetical protein
MKKQIKDHPIVSTLIIFIALTVIAIALTSATIGAVASGVGLLFLIEVCVWAVKHIKRGKALI